MIEVQKIWDSNKVQKYICYTGPSMYPTLKPGDLLYITPYDGHKTRKGDVIAFKPPNKEICITHRVISVEPGAIRVRGDNNTHTDPWALNPDHIIGKVTQARGKRGRRILGGTPGHVYALVIHALNRGKDWVGVLFRPVYHWFAQKGVPKRWLPFHLKMRVITFSRRNGTEMQLFVGRYVIGRLRPGSNRWQILSPFRLIVDEASLPALQSIILP